MTETLSEMFEGHRSDTVNHRGRIVKAVVRAPVRDDATVIVTRLQHSDVRPQGLKLAVNRGSLDVNGHRSPAVTLWSHTSPDEVRLHVRGAGATTLDIWNAWAMGGVDTSWVGNAGIVTRTTATGMVLRCSDGVGPAEFSDLVVEIAVER